MNIFTVNTKIHHSWKGVQKIPDVTFVSGAVAASTSVFLGGDSSAPSSDFGGVRQLLATPESLAELMKHWEELDKGGVVTFKLMLCYGFRFSGKTTCIGSSTCIYKKKGR